jgi:hypothetical protein
LVLWTIQPIAVYEQIQESGIYRCDFEKSIWTDFRDDYAWLVRKMKIKIGSPPEGVSYPVWAWYMQDGVRKKPDLRRERWQCGRNGEQFACMEIDISDDCVVLSDFENWSVILLHGLLSDSEEEYERLENEYNGLPEKNKKAFVDKNWERVFDLTPLDNDWTRRGATIQATFWELRKENIRKVRIFTSGTAA